MIDIELLDSSFIAFINGNGYYVGDFNDGIFVTRFIYFNHAMN